MMSTENKNKNILIAIVLYFQQSLKFFFTGDMIATVIGNFDPLYGVSLLDIFQNRKKIFRYSRLIYILFLILIYSILQFITQADYTFSKAIITFMKLVICFLVLNYFIYNSKRIDFKKILLWLSVIHAIALGLSFMFYESSLFWTTNDTVNVFNLTRLRLFYYEPSELGFRVGIILIMLIGYFLVEKKKRDKIYISAAIIVNSICLYYARPMGAITIGAISIVCLLINDLFVSRTKQKTMIYSVMFAVIFLFLVFMVISDSTIYQRIIATFNGDDSSTRYRIGIAYKVMIDSMKNTQLIGIGLGNLNTVAFRSQYEAIGLVTVVTNSLAYFIIELGTLGIILVLVLVFCMVNSYWRTKSSIALGLIIFIFLYQAAGGYFTNSLNWIVYGIVMSGFSERLR